MEQLQIALIANKIPNDKLQRNIGEQIGGLVAQLPHTTHSDW